MDIKLRAGYRLGVAAAVSLLIACGGGGGGGGDGSSGSGGSSANAVAITPTNAGQVAAEAFAATNGVVSGANTGTDLVVPFMAGDGSDLTFNLRRFAEQYLQRLKRRSSGQLLTAQLAYEDEWVCSGGGTSVDVWDDADNNFTDSAGDSYSTTYNNCNEGGVTSNGRVTATLVRFSGDVFVDYTMSGTFSFDNFAVSYAGYSASINGGMSYSATRVGSADTSTITIASLSFSDSGGSTTIQNATLQYSYNTSSLAYSYTFSAAVGSSAMGGQVMVTTLAPFAGSGASYPVSGSMRVTGAAGSSVTLTATGGGNVRLDVDANGDGVIDSTTITSWAALTAL